MKTKIIAFRIGALALVASAATAITVACSSNSTNPGPDAGTASTTNSGSSSGSATTTTGTSSGGSDASGDSPSCASDAASCNSCVTLASDPYNACSAYAANCVKFPHTVPSHPTL